MRIQYKYNRAQVLWLTGMTDGMLSQFQFDTGLQWLSAYTTSDEDMLRWIMSQPLIWKWWLNEWNRRDAGYLDHLYRHFEQWPGEVQAAYKCLQQECFIEYTPPWILLENGYTKFLGLIGK
jgi:hypothetical protein